MVDDKSIIRINVWRYTSSDGYEIFAGKSDKDNDILSLKLADSDDWWFHVRGVPGSHVLLRTSKSGHHIDNKILNQAASVAAYHSKSRKENFAFVSGTLAKYVTKPRYSKPGTVVIRNERVFKVKPTISF